jgi:hypothetical protein
MDVDMKNRKKLTLRAGVKGGQIEVGLNAG